MRLLLKVNANDENFEGCDVALVDVTPKIARRYLELIDGYSGVKALSSGEPGTLCYLAYWDCHIYFLHSSVCFEDGERDLRDEVFDQEVVEPSESWKVDLNNTEQVVYRTACDMLFVDQHGVMWRAYPKYGSERLETAKVEPDLLQEIACEGYPPPSRGDLKEVLMELGTRLVMKHRFDASASPLAINCEQLEQILFREDSCIAAEDVPGLMRVIRKEAFEKQRRDPSTAPIKHLTDMLNRHAEAREELRMLGYDWPALHLSPSGEKWPTGETIVVDALLKHTMLMQQSHDVPMDRAIDMVFCNARDDKPHEYWADDDLLREINVEQLDTLISRVIDRCTCSECCVTLDVVVADDELLECRACGVTFDPFEKTS